MGRILVQITGVTILTVRGIEKSEHIQGELFMLFQERIWLPLLGRCKRCNTGPTEVGSQESLKIRPNIGPLLEEVDVKNGSGRRAYESRTGNTQLSLPIDVYRCKKSSVGEGSEKRITFFFRQILIKSVLETEPSGEALRLVSIVRS